MTYNEVAGENLQNLGAQASAVGEDLLQEPDEEMADGRAEEGTIDSHFGNPGSEVVAMLVAVLGQPRGDEFLSAG